MSYDNQITITPEDEYDEQMAQKRRRIIQQAIDNDIDPYDLFELEGE